MSSFLASLSNYNASYQLLTLCWFQSMYASTRGTTVRLGYRNNVDPRESISRIEKEGKISPRAIAKMKRRQAAHQNCLEGLIVFSAAVVAGNQVGLSTVWMNGMSLTYFALRCMYIHFYVSITTQRASFLRSLCWWGSNFCFLTTLWKAGSAINK